jgi:predicted RNA-binding protein with RPS1 domain
MTTYDRGDEIDVVVTGTQHYGVLVETNDGEKGWIESEYLSGLVLEPRDWPPVGTVLRGLVLGRTRDGRIRVCLREVDGHSSPQSWPPADEARHGG